MIATRDRWEAQVLARQLSTTAKRKVKKKRCRKEIVDDDIEQVGQRSGWLAKAKRNVLGETRTLDLWMAYSVDRIIIWEYETNALTN